MKKSYKKTASVYVAMSVAVLAVCSWISIPTDPPITMQSFGVLLLCSVLSPKYAFLSTLVYVVMGALGLPVFSSFRGGIGIFISSAGGFILTFPIVAPVVSLLLHKVKHKYGKYIAAYLVGCLLLYLVGTVYFSAVILGDVNLHSLGVAFLRCVLPFLLPDFIKCILASYVSERLKERIYLP